MASPTSSNLFPPIIDTYLPAFLQGDNFCNIVFKLSQFNVAADFNLDLTQITVSNINTNKTMLNLTDYPNEIKVAAAAQIDKDTYSIVLNGTDLKGGVFELNTYYKIQIRLTKAGIVEPDKYTASWFNNNIENFSEWSTVCLIRAIAMPVISLNGLSATDPSILTVPNVIGKLEFADVNEKDSIYCYKVLVSKEQNGNISIIEESDFIYPEPTKERELNYIFKTSVDTSKGDYSVLLYIATKTGYLINETYKLEIDSSTGETLGAAIQSINADEENGLMQITVQVTAETGLSNHKIILKRASSLNGFNTWDDLLVYSSDAILGKGTNFVFNDLSIQSGIWYKYAIQGEDKTTGERTSVVYEDSDEPQMIIFEHMFLVADGRQLKIKYNPSVSTYKRNIQESQTTTLGAQYPFIRRNGSVDYYQLNISGMISALSDEDEIQIVHSQEGAGAAVVENISRGRLFGSKEFIYGGEEQAKLYEKYNKSENIGKYNDIIYEKMFRDKVIDFLYEDNVKLFKSTPEGNRLVKIMNVNLTPESGLGRYVYTFSCDAIEVAEPTVENLLQNKIQTDMIEAG